MDRHISGRREHRPPLIWPGNPQPTDDRRSRRRRRSSESSNARINNARLVRPYSKLARLKQFSCSRSTQNIGALIYAIDQMPFVLTETERLVEPFFAVSDNIASDKARSQRLQFIQQSLA